MYGVVLWSDLNKNCAVIWCEDHSSLAYFKDDRGVMTDGLAFGPGDLVEFEVRMENDMRLALDPSIVAAQQYPGLADDLIRAGEATQAQSQAQSREPMSLPGHDRGTSHVLPFPDIFERSNAANGRPNPSGRKYG